MREFRIIVEEHPEGFVAYPLGLNGVVVGEGDTHDTAVADQKSAISLCMNPRVADAEPCR